MTGNLRLLRMIATVSLICLILSQVIFVVNMIFSYFKGQSAGKNPWKANTLEWSIDSPPPHGNFSQVQQVYRWPYEYSAPGRREDWWPQNVLSE